MTVADWMADLMRIGQYDFEQAAPGHIFCSECGYRNDLHIDGRCPNEAEARAAFGDR